MVDIIRELADYDIRVDVHDPWADPAEALAEYGVNLVGEPEAGAYDAVVVAVAHPQFREMGAAAIRAYGKAGAHVLYDLKYILGRDEADMRL